MTLEIFATFLEFARLLFSSLQILYALRQDDVLAADTHPLSVSRCARWNPN